MANKVSLSKTCLVRFDSEGDQETVQWTVSPTNRYSVEARAVGRPVEIRAYAERVEFWQDGQVVGRHPRAFGNNKAVYDPLHYIPVLARKPGALRSEPLCAIGSSTMANAPFKEWDLPPSMRRVQRKLGRVPNGDRQMVDILGAVLTDGLDAVEAACAEALAEGVHSADVILDILARRREPAPPLTIATPEASCQRRASGTTPHLRARRRLCPLRQPQETPPWNDRRCWTRWAS